MNIQEAHDAMKLLATNVALAASLTADQVLYEDVSLSAAQQALIEGTSSPIRPWIRINIKDNLRSQRTIGGPGNRRFENEGVIIVEVYTVRGDGRTTANTLAPALRDAFENINEGSLWFRNAATRPVGNDGFWFHTNVVAEFMWEEVK